MQQDFNLFAYLALFGWPLISLLLYKNMPVYQATVWTVLGAMLLLPVGAGVKIVGIPQIDKAFVATICALVGCLFASQNRLRLWTEFGLVEILILYFVISPLLTSILNGDTIYFATGAIAGVGVYDGISASISQVLFIIPFLLGRAALRSAQSGEATLKILATSGLCYSALLLFEIRFSPQLHYWAYGVTPGQFLQSVREGGYRPMAFMGHGLLAAFYLMTATVAAVALWRLSRKIFIFPAGGLAAFLFGVLVLCKSLGALIYGVFCAPVVRFASPTNQCRIAVLLALLAVTFPLLRISNVFPTSSLVEIASFVNEERGASLKFRFDNEDRLLEKANERFWFGWGRYARSRAYDEEGRDLSITDGYWIITFGQFGWLGFLGAFLLITLPVLRAYSALRHIGVESQQLVISAISLIVALVAVEQLPNASVSPWTWLLAGSLLGQAEAYKKHAYMRTRH